MLIRPVTNAPCTTNKPWALSFLFHVLLDAVRFTSIYVLGWIEVKL